MDDAATPSTFRLILIPTLLTLLVNVLRLVGEVNGWFPNASGGAFHFLGIFWFGLAFALWFAYRLRRAGSGPRVARPWLWSLLSLLPIVVAFGATAPGLMELEADEAGYAALRFSGICVSIAAYVAMAVQFVVWPRLAWTLLCYAIPARLTVVAITWIAETKEGAPSNWDTHYTKFGPKGWDRDMENTMAAASLMQLGFWVGVTVVFGTLLGGLFFGRKRPSG